MRVKTKVRVEIKLYNRPPDAENVLFNLSRTQKNKFKKKQFIFSKKNKKIEPKKINFNKIIHFLEKNQKNRTQKNEF